MKRALSHLLFVFALLVPYAVGAQESIVVEPSPEPPVTSTFSDLPLTNTAPTMTAIEATSRERKACKSS